MRVFVCILVWMPLFLSAQLLDKPICISLFNNSTMMPGADDLIITSSTIHPGFSIGTEHKIAGSSRNMFLQTVKLGYFYHRLSEHGIMGYTEFVYRKRFNSGIYVSPMIGGGYLHAIPDMDVFELKEGIGLVKKKNLGRSQALASISFEAGHQYKETAFDFYFAYQFWLQMPFVKGYVPILPNTSLHIGIRYCMPGKVGGKDE